VQSCGVIAKRVAYPSPSKRLDGNGLKVSFRSLVSLPDLPAIEDEYQLLAGLVRRGGSEEFRRLLKPSPTFIVQGNDSRVTALGQLL
jgi:hypothetical protein